MNTLLRIGQLLAATGPVDGRKKFQKIVHILQVCGISFEVSYNLHHYGPYSDDLRGNLDTLIGDELLRETNIGNPKCPTYRLELAEHFTDLLKDFRIEATPKFEQLVKMLNEKDARELEGISTILFLKERRWTGEGLKEAFSSVKPHLQQKYSEYLSESQRIVTAGKTLAVVKRGKAA